MTTTRRTGTPETQRFYDEKGWLQQNGASVDRNLFGVKEDGPIRVELHHVHNTRIRAALSRVGTGLNLLECGCGGNPERMFLDLCSRYTAVDFSDTGVQVARTSFADIRIPHEFHTGDVCALPFEDGAFDAIYCAHMIYHIEDPGAQEAAIAELLRVVRTRGVVVLIVANPHPFAYPMRFARRVAADTVLLGSLLNRLRPKPPLPYKPMPIAWFRRRLAKGGAVEVQSAGIPSMSFYQNVSEFRGIGKLLWMGVRWLDVNFPTLSAYLGNYVIFTCRKSHKADLSEQNQ